jgi:hypothetical protein
MRSGFTTGTLKRDEAAREDANGLRGRPPSRLGGVAAIGGVVAAFDTVLGIVVALGLDPARVDDGVLIVSLVAGAAMYALDARSPRRLAVWMLGLWMLRWTASCFAGPEPASLVVPWRNSQYLIAAFVLLQYSKMRQSAHHTRVGTAS